MAILSSVLVVRADENAGSQNGQPPANYADILPRTAPLEPDEAMRSLAIVNGYRVTMAAAEPLVHDPVAVSFDADGRLFVVEMCDYSEQSDERLGAVRMLKDDDGDGLYETSTVFADGLSWPTAVICYGGGVYVGAAPDIWFFKDTDQDGVADIRTQVFTGFGRTNVQGLFNSFLWGVDNRIYGQTSTSGATVVQCDTSAPQSIQLNGRDFSFDPRSHSLRAESGGAQHGMCFDDWGHRFASHNSDHLQQFVYADRLSSQDASDIMPPTRQSIALDGPQAEVFRISPIEPWRILRTQLRVSKTVPGLVEGGGRPAGYFTGATGATVYRGDAMPEILGQVFIGDVGSNIVHRKRLVDVGVHYVGQRIDENREFLASKDTWFRPVQFANGPDGALYIVDMYREVIEHPASLPPDIKRHLDLTSGRDRGRIYRVTPDSYTPRPLEHLSSLSPAELVEYLQHPNGWHRDTASRLLYERNDRSVIALLNQLLAKSEFPQGRLHALFALEGLNALPEHVLQRSTNDPHPGVRENAIAIAVSRLDSSMVLRREIVSRLDDNSPRVRFQAALALSTSPVSDSEVSTAILNMLRRDGEDRWLLAAALRAIPRDDCVKILLQLASMDGTAMATQALAQRVGCQPRDDELSRINDSLSAVHMQPERDFLLRGLLESWATQKTRQDWRDRLRDFGHLSDSFEKILERSRKQIVDDLEAIDVRLEAIRILQIEPSEMNVAALSQLVGAAQPRAIQIAAIDALQRVNTDAVAATLVEAWPQATPTVRSAIGRALVSRTVWTIQLLAAVEDSRIGWNEIEPALQDQIRSQASDESNHLIRRIESNQQRQSLSRSETFESYRKTLGMNGEPSVGRAHFQKLCASCHRVENIGFDLGPNLAAFKFRGSEAILINLIDPNREVNPQYVNYVAVTKDERIVTGMLASETATSITLIRGENATETVMLSDLDSLKSSQKSIMPEGLEQQLDHQAMADLLSYLLSLP